MFTSYLEGKTDADMPARNTGYDSDESSETSESHFPASFEALADAEAELQSLLERKEEIDRYLATIECTIYNVETSYLQDTQSGGNLVSSTDGQSSGFSNRAHVKERAIREEDRLFSCSSLTYLETLSIGNSELSKSSYTPISKSDTDRGSPNLSDMHQTPLTPPTSSQYPVPQKYKTRGRPSFVKKKLSTSSISTSNVPYFATKPPSPSSAFKRKRYEKSDRPIHAGPNACSMSPEPVSYARPIKRICLGRKRKSDVQINDLSDVVGDTSYIVQVARLSSPISLPFDRHVKDEEDS